ncbi:hypothetical protein ACP4OV_006244 [Aristida adscensionis]
MRLLLPSPSNGRINSPRIPAATTPGGEAFDVNGRGGVPGAGRRRTASTLLPQLATGADRRGRDGCHWTRSIAAFAGVGTFVVLDTRQPLYSVAIASVSGLDPAAADLSRAALDPEFNLPSAEVEVSYRGVRLAGAPAPRLCAEPGCASEVGRVVAWGAAVRVPGFALDSLAVEMRRGAAAFDVTLTVADGLAQCTARRVGDDGALLDPCPVSSVQSPGT